MRLWPFGNRAVIEERASVSNAVIDTLLANATSGTAEASATAAATAAVGIVSSVLSTARPSGLQAILTPGFLHDYAARMLLHGNFVGLIDVDLLGNLTVHPSMDYKVAGTFRPSTWTYELKLPSPTRSEGIRLRRPAAGVVHTRIGAKSSSPWAGRSPLIQAGLTSKALASIEKSLGLDSTIPTGGIMPQPDASSAKAINAVKTALRDGKGGLTLIETTAQGYGQGGAAAPRKDWEQTRFGPVVPAANVKFRDAASLSILRALGVPAKVFDGDLPSYRVMIATTVQSLARLLEYEVRDKLEVDVMLSLRDSGAIDVRGLGRALDAMVRGKMSVEDARRFTGLTDDNRLI